VVFGNVTVYKLERFKKSSKNICSYWVKIRASWERYEMTCLFLWKVDANDEWCLLQAGIENATVFNNCIKADEMPTTLFCSAISETIK